MKATSKYFFILFILLSTISTIAQRTENVEFTYDLSGNRTLRQVIILDDKNLNNEQSINIYTEILDEVNISIYPNPTKGAVIINLNEVKENTYVFLHTLNGTLLIKEKVIDNGHQVNLSSYKDGSYILSILINSKKRDWKIIKQ